MQPPAVYERSVGGEGVAQEISDLVVYMESVKFKSFVHSRAKYDCTQMSSFAERKAMSIVKKYGKDWVQHNVAHVSRVYPHGTRFDSSNYNPLVLWLCGCQMVALNYQTSDIPMQLNRAMFERNGSSGYILKPSPMRYLKGSFNPDSTQPISGIPTTTLSITVISGQRFNSGVAKGFCAINVETIGLGADSKSERTSKRKVHNNTCFNETFEWRDLLFSDMVFVRFSVPDSLVGAQRIIPLSCLREGYRHVTLRDEEDRHIPMASIFVKISITTSEPVPSTSKGSPKTSRNTSSSSETPAQ